MVKKPKILKDIDEFVLEKFKGIGEQQEEKLIIEDLFPKCKNCSGQMQRVIPAIELPVSDGILELHECVSCHEREYL